MRAGYVLLVLFVMKLCEKLSYTDDECRSAWDGNVDKTFKFVRASGEVFIDTIDDTVSSNIVCIPFTSDVDIGVGVES